MREADSLGWNHGRSGMYLELESQNSLWGKERGTKDDAGVLP